MKINEVEQKAGISKKNIRFYEDQGLIHPAHNKTNGYREYTEEDLECLLKVKLLRRLSVPIEEIRHILDGELTLKDCLERHQIYLNHEAHSLELMKEMSRRLAEECESFEQLEPSGYLREMETLENGGGYFMNVERTDVGRKKKSAMTAAGVMIVLMLGVIILFLSLSAMEPAPLPVMVIMVLVPLAVIVGVALALRERLKELDKGEEYEAAKY